LAIDRLLAVFAKPDRAPFSASSNFLRSYSVLILASSSAFLRYSSLAFSSSSLSLSSYSICSAVFSGGASTASSDIFFKLYLFIDK
jgi:hypothetical protein